MITRPGSLVARLKGELEELTKLTSNGLAPQQLRTINVEIRDVMNQLGKLLHELDPIRQPPAVFDPSNPKIIGRFIALALVAQPRVSLSTVKRFYGSGVYAIYYRGDFGAYEKLAGSETPIYVGQAAPAMGNARTPMEQGDRLARRLEEHRKNIKSAESSLKITDFECRALVIQSGWESPAEDYLIRLFRPIWNSETNILYGLGKHGDAADTRQNKRSPWDTLHPGRKWAKAEKILDARSLEEIDALLIDHFEKTRIYQTIDDVLAEFIAELRQL